MKTTQKLLTLFVLMLTISAFTIKPKDGYKIGDIATDFKLENIDGSMVSLSDFNEAKGFIVTFTCNTCPYAVAYEDRIEALNKKYASKGYPVIAIMPNNTDVKPGDALPEMTKRAEEKGFPSPILFFNTQ
mgnify:CR=1 FL=1